MKDQERYRYDMLILAKMGYNIISNISRILKILYHIIYPNMRYYIRYRHAMIYIFPTTELLSAFILVGVGPHAHFGVRQQSQKWEMCVAGNMATHMYHYISATTE